MEVLNNSFCLEMLAENYRTILLISKLLKIIEKMIKRRLIVRKTILPESSFGLQLSRTTNDVMFSFLEDLDL